MKIEELNSLWAKDSKIDEAALINESAKIPTLHAKYYGYYVTEVMRLRKAKFDRTELEKAKFEYYNGTLDPLELKERGWKPNALKILRADIDKYIQSDPDVIKLNMKIAILDETVKYLEDIIRQIHSRNFIIKNMIDYMRFTQGSI